MDENTVIAAAKRVGVKQSPKAMVRMIGFQIDSIANIEAQLKRVGGQATPAQVKKVREAMRGLDAAHRALMQVYTGRVK